MQPGPFAGIVRVMHSREDLLRATEVGLEKRQEGYSPEALVLAIDEVLENMPLSRAIALYVQAKSREDGSDMERPISWLSTAMSLVFAAFCAWLIGWLFHLVAPNSGLLDVFLIVLGQAILLRFAFRGVRLAVMSVCDALNEASYPTNLHPLRKTSSAMGTLRLRRLRALIVDTSSRLVAGEKAGEIQRDLVQVNLTPRAAPMVVWLARARAAIADYLPPYENRWLAWLLAIAFVVSCMIAVQNAGDRVAEGYRNYASALTGWLAVDIAARPRRRPRSPAS